MMIFRIRPSQHSNFLTWQLNCPHVYAQASCDIIGSTSPHVNVEQIKNFRLVIPSRREQQEISDFIKFRCSSLDELIDRAAREIALIREYRTRLVADVVTGQLDVREAAAKLPQEPEELEPIDDAETSVESEEALNGSDLEAETAEEHV